MKELMVFLIHSGTEIENNLSVSEKRKKIWIKNADKKEREHLSDENKSSKRPNSIKDGISS